MSADQSRVRAVLEGVKAAGRNILAAAEAREIGEAYSLPSPKEGLATSVEEAVRIARGIGFPVALKIVSPDIIHKTEAGGVLLGVGNAREVRQGYRTIMANAWHYRADAQVIGVQVQQMVTGGHEVIIGATADPAFGPVVMFGMGGVLVETLQDTTFRLAPTTQAEALRMLDEIRGAPILRGVRGQPPVNREALATLVERVSQLTADFPEITEVDLNPVMASEAGAIAVDVRIIVDFHAAGPRARPSPDEMLAAMRRILMPDAIAVIGASPEKGKIGYAVMENIINGGYEGQLYPIHPRADDIVGRPCYRNVKDIPGPVDIAIFCIPARFVAQVMEECGDKGVRGAILIPSGFAEIGESQLQQEVVDVARKHNIRLMGPNIYGFYYTPKNLCATFCTPYSERGKVALTSQSGGVGMAIIGFSRTNKMGVSAIIGLGNKSDIDEDDLLTFFEQDPHTQVVAMHVEDLKDGRAFAEVAQRVAKQKPVVMLKAGRTEMGARAARSHTGALAGNDRVYEAVLRQAGVIRARHLNEMLEYARALDMLPTPKGESVLVVTGAGGSGVLLSDACVDHGLQLMAMPPDLDQAFRQFIPPFGAAGNPVDITGGEPPETYKKTIDLALYEPRVHALILGYWHTIITPPMVFAHLVVDAVEEARRQGIDKPVVASLVGDVEVEEAARDLQDHRILAYPYETEKPVAGLGAKYRWARFAGLL
ncbi:MAG: acetate--CoA ligase family protein [Nitrospinae bacterium]|nr:acetate--CoA ligase family protein [Nitrospinota bacterium]